MSVKNPFFAFLCAFSVIFGLCSAQEMKDSSTGKSFPATVTLDFQGKQHELSGTGVSTRKKFFVKVYSVASYIEDPNSVKGEDVYSNILNSDKPKQLTLKWVRSVGKDKVQEGYRDSLGKHTGNAEHIIEFVDLFGNVSNGDTHVIRWLPDGTVTVEINGEKKGEVKSADFAKALWSVWFARDSVVNRKQLVSNIR